MDGLLSTGPARLVSILFLFITLETSFLVNPFKDMKKGKKSFLNAFYLKSATCNHNKKALTLFEIESSFLMFALSEYTSIIRGDISVIQGINLFYS